MILYARLDAEPGDEPEGAPDEPHGNVFRTLRRIINKLVEHQAAAGADSDERIVLEPELSERIRGHFDRLVLCHAIAGDERRLIRRHFVDDPDCRSDRLLSRDPRGHRGQKNGEQQSSWRHHRLQPPRREELVDIQGEKARVWALLNTTHFMLCRPNQLRAWHPGVSVI